MRLCLAVVTRRFLPTAAAGRNEAPVLLGYGQQLIAERLISGWRPTHRLAATRPQVNESTRERLRALGYVD